MMFYEFRCSLKSFTAGFCLACLAPSGVGAGSDAAAKPARLGSRKVEDPKGFKGRPTDANRGQQMIRQDRPFLLAMQDT